MFCYPDTRNHYYAEALMRNFTRIALFCTLAATLVAEPALAAGNSGTGSLATTTSSKNTKNCGKGGNTGNQGNCSVSP